MALRDRRDLFRRTGRDQHAAAIAAFGPKVEHPVGGLHHIQVVLDDDNRVARIDQFVEHFQQLLYVLEVQAGGRLVEDVQCTARRAFREFLGEFHALGLAARQRGGLLADLHIAEADLVQRVELRGNRRYGGEEFRAVLDRHVEHIGNRLALEMHVQRLAVIALALAGLAGDVDIRQEVHLDLDDAVALAGFAAPALDVEAEPARRITARFRFRQAGIPVPDRAEGAGIGGGVGARCAPDRRLVDVDDLVEMLQALKAGIGRRRIRGTVELAGERLVQRLDDQRGLAAAGDAGDAGERAERDRGGDVLEIVSRRAFDDEAARALGDGAAFRYRDFARAVEIVRRQAFRVRHHFGRRAFGDDLAAMHTGGRAHVDDMVGREDRIFIVLYHDH